MNDDFFNFLVATGELDDFLGYKGDPKEQDEEDDEEEETEDE